MKKSSKIKSITVLILIISIIQSWLFAFANESKNELKLKSPEINININDSSSHLLIIEDAENLSTTLTIKHKEKVLKPIRIKATLEDNNLILDLAQILPVQFLPEGEYIIIARQRNKKLIGKFELYSEGLIPERL